MKKFELMFTLALCCLLAACGAASGSASGSAPASSPAPSMTASSETASSSAPAASDAPAASESAAASATASGRAKTTVMDFVVEGDTESLPATLYEGDGWSLYLPDEGWARTDTEAGATWLSVDNEAVGLSVTTFPSCSAAEARQQYVEGSGFVFEDLTAAADEVLTGTDEDGDILELMTAEQGGTTYLIAWTYPEEAIEGFGARLPQIAATFELMN